MSEILHINVGGVVYTTTRATLVNFPDSMIGSMFSGRMSTLRDENGHYFIDRDGHIFRYVLNFLRSSCLSLPNDFKDWELLETEADFYQVPELISAVNEVKYKRNNPEKTPVKKQTLIEMECKKESMRVMYFRIYGERCMMEMIESIKQIVSKPIGWYREGNCLHIHGDVEDRHKLIQDFSDAGFELKFTNISLSSISGVGVQGSTTATVEKWLFTRDRDYKEADQSSTTNSH